MNRMKPPSTCMRPALDGSLDHLTDAQFREQMAESGWSAPYNFVTPFVWPTSESSSAMMLMSLRMATHVDGVEKPPGTRSTSPVISKTKRLDLLPEGTYDVLVTNLATTGRHRLSVTGKILAGPEGVDAPLLIYFGVSSPAAATSARSFFVALGFDMGDPEWLSSAFGEMHRKVRITRTIKIAPNGDSRVRNKFEPLAVSVRR